MGTADFDSWNDSEFDRTRERRLARMARAHCPDCDASITVNRPRIGAEVICRECGANLEIVSVEPLEVDHPYGADFGGEYDDYDEY